MSFRFNFGFHRFLFPHPSVKRLADIKDEAQFLAGRHSGFRDLSKVLRIAMEFIRGYRGLHSMGPAVTVFGSARFKEDHPYYKLAREVGLVLAREGWTVITGGGPGIMEAANRGTQEAGGHSVGCNIILPREQGHNRYLDRVVTFYYFFVRKVMLVKYSYAFIILPGGFGTLDEMSEALTLIQTGKLYDFPVILMGSDYWKGLTDWMRDTLIAQKTVHEKDLDFLKFTDDPAEALRFIDEATKNLLAPDALRRPAAVSTPCSSP